MSRKPVEPWGRLRPPYRLGLKMGLTDGPGGGAAIGFAMIALGPDGSPQAAPPAPRVRRSGEDRVTADGIVAAMLNRLETEQNKAGFAGVDLYLYANRAAFKGSRPHREGMSLEAHTKQVREIEALLRMRGIDVNVIEVTRPL